MHGASAELRTIGLCDATDSELSIRHLADSISSVRPAAEHAACLLYLSPTYPHPPLPPPRRRRRRQDSSCESFVLAGTEEENEDGDASAIAAAANEHDAYANNDDDDDDGDDVQMDVQSQSSSYTNSAVDRDIDADTDERRHSICPNVHRKPPAGRSAVTVTQGDDGLVRVTFRKQQPKKYHSALNRIRNESVMRSRSFQEQGVKPLLRNSRFFVSRHQSAAAAVHQLDTICSDLHLDTVSQRIEITVQDEHGVRIGGTASAHRAVDCERDIGQADVASVSEGGAYDSGSQEHLKSASGGALGGSGGQLLLRLIRRMRHLTWWRRPKPGSAKALRRGDGGGGALCSVYA